MQKIFKILLIMFFLCEQKSINCQVSFLDESLHPNKKIIMIDPAGHAGDAGRDLKNSNERAETFKMASYIQFELEKRNDDLSVMLTRSPGEIIIDFQNSSFANRMNVDFFVSLHFYSESTLKPKIFVYHYIVDPVADFVCRSITCTEFVPVVQAHRINAVKTRHISHQFKTFFESSNCSAYLEFGQLLEIPVKPLLGLVAPGILLEIGWPHGDTQGWKEISDLIVTQIDELY